MAIVTPADGETRAERTLIARDPATGATLGEVQATSPDQIDALVEGVAHVQPLWALLRVVDRARYMRRMAQAIVDELDTLTETIAREQGRPRAEVAALELLSAIDALRWIAREGAGVLGGRRVRTHRSLSVATRARVAYEPYGVIGVIGAGSAPFAQPLGQIAGALLAGNGVVVKPARRACLAGEAIMRVVGRAGLPEGLVAIAHGGAQVGVALARAPIGKVLFTGSPTVGRAVARECVSREREVTVELGGKDAMLVLVDADLDNAATGALWAGCAGAGQARGAVERVYVAREVAEPFVERLVARARAYAVGNPVDRAEIGRHVQMGPLSSQRRLQHVSELVDEALAQGAQLRCGGPMDPPPGCSGAWYAPAVVTNVSQEMRLMREPLDGPVLAVMAVDSVEQAIALTNDCEYGLGASVWSADRYRGARIAGELRTGMVWCNDHLPGPTLTRGPWGAAAGGGLGKTLGEAGLRACAQEKLIAWSTPGLRGLWWGPYDETTLRAAQAVARLRSGRESDRERAWRRGGPAIVRVGARMLGRGVPR
jgi:succinate-semialdehyde dehydrogenase/glutarate-semialdehyde dehydrogenase